MRKGRTPILTLFISSLLLINTVMVSEDIRALNDRIKEEKTLTNKSFASIHHMLYSQMYKHMIEMMKHELRILRELSKILPENMHSSQNQDHGKVKSSHGKGRTLYVGGTGPNNYTKIQDAINDANDGDTIFVYSGVYKENLIINKTINLIGEKRETTIINSSNRGIIIDIRADNVTIQNFTLQSNSPFTTGISITSSNYNTITNTTIENCWYGIGIAGLSGNSNYNTITNTTIENCKFVGILIGGYSGNSNYNTITNTTIENCWYGIATTGFFGKSNYNTITNTTIENCKFVGITITGYFGRSNYNKVVNSLVTNNSVGVYIFGIGSAENTFYLNRFINNSDGNAFALSKNIWDNGTVGNYWDDYSGNDSDGDGIGDIPYKIPPLEEVNKDRYPLGRFLTNITPPPDKNPPVIRRRSPLLCSIYVGNHPIPPPIQIARRVWNKTLIFLTFRGITIKVEAIDYETDIKKVEFYVDDETEPRDIEIKQHPEQYTFEWCWDETMFLEEHTVRAVAYDKADNTATLTINIQVIASIHLPRFWGQR